MGKLLNLKEFKRTLKEKKIKEVVLEQTNGDEWFDERTLYMNKDREVIDHLFSGVELERIDFSMYDFSKIKRARDFLKYAKVKVVDLREKSFDCLEDSSGMFSLQEVEFINLEECNFPVLTTAPYMFGKIRGNAPFQVNLKNTKFPSLKCWKNLFGESFVRTIDLSSSILADEINLQDAFLHSTLKEVYFPTYKKIKLIGASRAFYGCDMEMIDLSMFEPVFDEDKLFIDEEKTKYIMKNLEMFNMDLKQLDISTWGKVEPVFYKEIAQMKTLEVNCTKEFLDDFKRKMVTKKTLQYCYRRENEEIVYGTYNPETSP